MGSVSAPVPVRATPAPPPMTGAWAPTPTALEGSGSVPIPKWQEGCALLAHPERLAEEYRRRGPAGRQPKPTTLTTLAAQLGKLRQGLARLIDSDTEGLIDKPEFEPRLSRLRQRIAHLEAQRQQRAEEAALHTELHLIMGRLEDFAAQDQEGLAEADWHRKRALIRALVRRVEVAHDQVKVVFRIDPRPGDPSPEKKVCKIVGGVRGPPCGVPSSVGLTMPPSSTPACRNPRISFNTRLSCSL